jgi:hypothetical protein
MSVGMLLLKFTEMVVTVAKLLLPFCFLKKKSSALLVFLFSDMLLDLKTLKPYSQFTAYFYSG